MSEDPTYEVDVKLQRGDGTDDCDTVKGSVSANTLDQLDERLEGLRERLEIEVHELREIQPDGTARTIADDQSTLDAEEGSA